jgi:hypothetical protein
MFLAYTKWAEWGTFICGIPLIGLGLMSSLPGPERAKGALAGVAITAYAIWGISRSSGTFVYSPFLFAIPIGLFFALLAKAKKKPADATPPLPKLDPADERQAPTEL